MDWTDQIYTGVSWSEPDGWFPGIWSREGRGGVWPTDLYQTTPDRGEDPLLGESDDGCVLQFALFGSDFWCSRTDRGGCFLMVQVQLLALFWWGPQALEDHRTHAGTPLVQATVLVVSLDCGEPLLLLWFCPGFARVLLPVCVSVMGLVTFLKQSLSVELCCCSDWTVWITFSPTSPSRKSFCCFLFQSRFLQTSRWCLWEYFFSAGLWMKLRSKVPALCVSSYSLLWSWAVSLTRATSTDPRRRRSTASSTATSTPAPTLSPWELSASSAVPPS